MRRYHPDWDLSTIPFDSLKHEYKRRLGSMGGRPIAPAPDPETEERRRVAREQQRARRAVKAKTATV